MKSRTSFFNGTVLRKDITRYAPVWGLYTIGLLLFMVVINLGDEAYNAADFLAETSSSLAVVNMILGGITALMVFGDLFKARLCYATHALPLRREGWFLTHFTAGFLFSFVPNLFIALCFLPMVMPYWYMALIWLAANTLQYLFFFGVGAFCAACAGNRLGAAAAYAIMNFFPLLISGYAEEIYAPMLYGMEYQWKLLGWLMPVSKVSTLDVVEYTRRPFQFMGFVTGDWIYLGIIAAVGIVLAILAVLIYRKRHMETAGDFLSLPAAKPVFLVVYTMAVGLLFYFMLSIDIFGLLIGVVIGYFTGKMLLQRTVKVFKGWSFLQLGILITALLLSIGLTAMDPLGVTRHVPNAKNVEVMYFYDSSNSHIYSNDDTVGRAIEDPAEMEKFLQFHEEVSDGRYEFAEEDSVNIYLQYELKSGLTVLRRYEIPVASTHGEFARKELSDWRSVFGVNDWDTLIDRVQQLELEVLQQGRTDYAQVSLSDPEQVRGLLEAVKADCDAGNMAQHWSFHQDEETYAWLYIYDDDYYADDDSVFYEAGQYYKHMVYSISLNIYDSCTHTREYINSLGLTVPPYGK